MCRRPTVATFPSELPLQFPTHRYAFDRWIGRGANGFVFEAIDVAARRKVAVKWLRVDGDSAKFVAREVAIQGALEHDQANLLGLHDVVTCGADVFMVLELFPSTLRHVCLRFRLSPTHRQRCAHQLLRGLERLHSMGIVHRDIKPDNVLYDDSNRLAICDFGMARQLQDVIDGSVMSDYVTTRWYRAPEVCGSLFSSYDEKIDVWAVGCIVAEMLIGMPLFPGRSSLEVLQMVATLLGKPSDAVVDRMTNPKAVAFYRSLRETAPSFFHYVRGGDAAELDLILSLLRFDPVERSSASQALAHPFFKSMQRQELRQRRPDGRWIWMDRCWCCK